MDDNKVKIDIELPEEDWVALEEMRKILGFFDLDGLINYILEEELKKYDRDIG